jgi:transcriptional regulator with XRE-family HTH domain
LSHPGEAMAEPVGPIAAARIGAGLSIPEAARRAGVCEAYVRRAERQPGSISYQLAQKLSRLYGVSANAFLYQHHLGGETPKHLR